MSAPTEVERYDLSRMHDRLDKIRTELTDLVNTKVGDHIDADVRKHSSEALDGVDTGLLAIELKLGGEGYIPDDGRDER